MIWWFGQTCPVCCCHSNQDTSDTLISAELSTVSGLVFVCSFSLAQGSHARARLEALGACALWACAPASTGLGVDSLGAAACVLEVPAWVWPDSVQSFHLQMIILTLLVCP